VRDLLGVYSMHFQEDAGAPANARFANEMSREAGQVSERAHEKARQNNLELGTARTCDHSQLRHEGCPGRRPSAPPPKISDAERIRRGAKASTDPKMAQAAGAPRRRNREGRLRLSPRSVRCRSWVFALSAQRRGSRDA
jgi:hypothetical protein